jgi:predicted DNA-binding transcriptional regulator AlpA
MFERSNEMTLPETGFLRLKQVLALIPVSKSTWWTGVATGRFPQPISLTPRTTAWRVCDIQLVIQQLGAPDQPWQPRTQKGGSHG